MILRPVCIGSCTDWRGMMPGALTSTRRRSATSVSGPLPSIGSPSAIDDPAEQSLAHRHVDDFAEAPDLVAFADLASEPKITMPTLSRSRLSAMPLHAGGGELDHFAGLDLVEAEHPGDAVAHRQHLADVGDLGFVAEILDLRLSGWPKSRRRGCPWSALGSLEGEFQGIELRLQRSVVEARSDLDLEAAQDGGIDAGLDLGILAQRRAQRRGQGGGLGVASSRPR